MGNNEAAVALHEFCRALDEVSNAWNWPEHSSKAAAESKFAAALERVRPLIPTVTECRPGGTVPAFRGRILECIDTAKGLALLIWTIPPTGTLPDKCSRDLQQEMRDDLPALRDELGRASLFLGHTAASGGTGNKAGNKGAGRPRSKERERIKKMFREGGDATAISREFPKRSADDLRQIKHEALNPKT